MSKENINQTIKEKLHLICEKIEQVLQECNESREQDRYLRQNEDIYNINSGYKINAIKNLKENVNLIQNNLEKIYDINKINKIESEIKKKNSTLKQLSKEKNVLLGLVQNQQKSIEDYSLKFTKNKEISDLRNRLKSAKEENQMNRETYNLLNSKIKGQLSKIDVLDRKTKIIRQNIEFQQKKEKKEVEKSIKQGENGEDDENDEKVDLESLIVCEKMLMLEINEEEKNFKNEIYKQRVLISQMSDAKNAIEDEINKIKQNLKNEQLKKENEIKNKEKSRNKNKIFKNKIKNNKNNTNNTNNYQKNIYNTNKIIYKIGVNHKNKEENENKNVFTSTKSNKKPFDMKKFSLINNGNNSSIKTFMEVNNHLSNGNISPYVDNSKEMTNIINNKSSALKEIEQLQKEIRYTLQNNVVIIQTDNNQIKGNEKIIDDNKINNENIIRKEQNENNNKKSKPFDKFNFN